jgi:hypothetical protein
MVVIAGVVVGIERRKSNQGIHRILRTGPIASRRRERATQIFRHRFPNQ